MPLPTAAVIVLVALVCAGGTGGCNTTATPRTISMEKQMAQLAELGYTPVSLDEVLAYYVDGAALPPRSVLITFDDGYRDNLANAVPVPERPGQPAFLFVPNRYLDGPRPLPAARVDA